MSVHQHHQQQQKLKDGSRKRLGVRFGNIVIYEFLQILGDNPAVSAGAPLTIGWKPISSREMDVDLYEHVRFAQRREGYELVVPKGDRERHLMSMGYTCNELIEATNEADRIRSGRSASLQNKKWDGILVVVMRAKSRMKKFIGAQQQQQQQQQKQRLNHHEKQASLTAISE